MNIDALRDALIRADYTTDAVIERLGIEAQDGLLRNSTIPARRRLADARDPQATCIKLFPLRQPVALAEAQHALDVDDLGDLLVVSGSEVHAIADLRPYGFERDGGDWDGWVVADHTPGLDTDITPVRDDYVLGVSPASTTLAQITPREPVTSALDLGTGCGVQSLHLSCHASRIVATDINPRALAMARLTAQLSGVTLDLRSGSLYEPVADERFDLICSNPPYVMSPPSRAQLTYREQAMGGDALVREVVSGSARHLTEHGRCVVLANWAITAEPWQERLETWCPDGCDMWVIERERLDPYAYIELWLKDAGLALSPDWAARYREWLDYFAEIGVEAIGMGWIVVVRTGSSSPNVTCEQWPYDVAQPVGAELGSYGQIATTLRRRDEELLDSRWSVRSDVRQETMGIPGEAEPQRVVMRQHAGLRRAMDVDAAWGGVIGACDGTMSLRTIVEAVSELTGWTVDRSDLMARVRDAIREGYLVAPCREGVTIPHIIE